MTTKQTHTPGPWTANPARFVAGANGDVAIVNDHHSLIAVAYVRNGEEQANARLIAAAPDLLAACRAVAGMEQRARAGEYIDWTSNGNEAIQLVRAAIAKAEGAAS